MSICEHSDQLRDALDQLEAFGLSKSIVFREEIRSGKRLVIHSEAKLINGSVLLVREYVKAKYKSERLGHAYRYHYSDGALVFRHDNAFHRPSLGFKEHKHLADGKIVPSRPPDVWGLVEEVISFSAPAGFDLNSRAAGRRRFPGTWARPRRRWKTGRRSFCGNEVFGDPGAAETPILPDPDVPEPCDPPVMESTYGDRLHDDRSRRVERLGAMLRRALSDGGKVFVPAFSPGRTQEPIYEMDRLFANGHLGPVPVFIDSPLGLEITRVYSRLSEFWGRQAWDLRGAGDHPIHFGHLYAVENHESHGKLLDMAGPAVIVAGGGMCIGGRILDHPRRGLSDPKNNNAIFGRSSRFRPFPLSAKGGFKIGMFRLP